MIINLIILLLIINFDNYFIFIEKNFIIKLKNLCFFVTIIVAVINLFNINISHNYI